ncbi:MAG: DUF5343 domain-containing protein, partial [Chloroflexota bacterium]
MGEPRARQAPYAPASSLQEFFDSIRSVPAPARVNVDFLRKLGVARGNEYPMLNALKFLSVIDERGVPSSAYPLLQTHERFQSILRDLTMSAYEPLIALGGIALSNEDLRHYFERTSSPPQATKAAAFFRSLASMAGLNEHSTGSESAPAMMSREGARTIRTTPEDLRVLLEAKRDLIQKLPAPTSDWSPEDYTRRFERFLDVLRNLD